MASFEKYPAKGYKWMYIVDLGKDPRTGKRIQRRKRGFETRNEAKAHCSELISKHHKGEITTPSKKLFKDYLNSWLKGKKRKVRQATLNKYTNFVENHLQPGLGSIEISKLTDDHITDFYDMLAVEKGLGNTTISDIHNVLKSALKQAVQKKLISENVAEYVEAPRKDQKVIEVWNYDESNRFLKTLRGYREYVAFLIALTTGMRQGEVLGLPWKNVDFENCTIAVTQTLEHDGKELTPKVKSRNSQRLISVDEETMAEVRQHKRLISQEKLALGPAYTDHDLVIPTSLGTPINPRNILRTQYRFMELAEVKKIDFHDLRPTHATMLLEAGENPKAVAERLGHDVRTLMETYAHVLPNMQKQTAQFRKKFSQQGQPTKTKHHLM